MLLGFKAFGFRLEGFKRSAVSAGGDLGTRLDLTKDKAD